MRQQSDLFVQINNAVLDLQLSDSQTFDQPLKKLGRLLNHAELQTYNQELTKNLNVDEFIKTSFETQGSYVGSAKLAWPDDDLKSLGLQLLLVQKFSESPDELIDFCHTFFYSNGKFSGHIQSFVTKLIIPFARDYKAYVVNQGTINLKSISVEYKKSICSARSRCRSKRVSCSLYRETGP